MCDQYRYFSGIRDNRRIIYWLSLTITFFIIPQKSFSYIKLLQINDLFINLPAKMNYKPVNSFWLLHCADYIVLIIYLYIFPSYNLQLSDSVIVLFFGNAQLYFFICCCRLHQRSIYGMLKISTSLY